MKMKEGGETKNAQKFKTEHFLIGQDKTVFQILVDLSFVKARNPKQACILHENTWNKLSALLCRNRQGGRRVWRVTGHTHWRDLIKATDVSCFAFSSFSFEIIICLLVALTKSKVWRKSHVVLSCPIKKHSVFLGVVIFIPLKTGTQLCFWFFKDKERS